MFFVRGLRDQNSPCCRLSGDLAELRCGEQGALRHAHEKPSCVFSRCKTEQPGWKERVRDYIIFIKYSWEMKANSIWWIFSVQLWKDLWSEILGRICQTSRAFCISEWWIVMKQESIKLTLKGEKPKSFHASHFNKNGRKLSDQFFTRVTSANMLHVTEHESFSAGFVN